MWTSTVNTCKNPGASQLPPLMFKVEDSKILSGFTWEVILPGYGFKILMLYAGKPQWLVRIIEGERNKCGNGVKQHPRRCKDRRN